MAELIFPIGFDLEKGVKEAQKDADKMIARISKAFENHPITVKVLLDQKSGLSSTVKAETQRAARELTGLKKEMAEINREWDALSAKDRGGDMGAQIMARYRALTQEAKGYTSTVAAAVKLEDKLARQREKSANAAAKAAQKTREYNNELRSQDGYISRLVKRLAVYAGFSAIRTFLTSVRDVTAEFELQRVSLGAIIQDQNRANQLFSEIKSFALKSPLKILDLTKYVKQVAAYRIETDKLFDTTKRLADVSVGLGVDMGRLVLAYGQVKAASYLRAAEIRQFTEAGIPMLELLAEKFTELQGKAVSTEQVMDMVSKRAVSFSMVEDIFNDMTSAGGMFYNMQEKQAQTLFGMWSKLGDAAAVMYEEIGNTDWVNEGMKEAIGLLESMMRNWRGVASAVGNAGFAFVAIKGNYTIMKLMQVNTIAAAAATRNYARAQEQLNAAKRDGNTLSAKVASLRARAAAANRVAANSTNLWTVANYKLRASLLSLRAVMSANWMGLLLSAIAALVSWFISARQEANRLNNELSKISAEGAANADAMVRNFERLAKVVVESADGSKKQHEALEELKRTYSDIIPAQNLTIDKLRAMKGAYEDVTKAIREKIYQQNLERQLSTIQEEYADKISKGEEKTKKMLASYGLDSNEIGRVMGGIKKAIDDGILDITSSKYKYAGVLSRIIKEQTGLDVKFDTGYNTDAAISFGKLRNSIEDCVDAYSEMTEKIKEQEEYRKGLTGTLGQYTKEWERVQKEIADNKIIAGPEDSQFLVSKQNDNNTIKSWVASLKTVLGDAWDETFVSLEESVGEKGDKMSYILFDKLMAPEVFEKLSYAQQQYIKQIQNEYNNLIPQDRTVASMQNALERIASQTGVSMDEMKRHLMNNGESWKDYSKRIRDSIKEYESEIDQMTKSNAAVANGESGVLKVYSDEEIKKAKDATEVLKLLLQYLAAAKGGGRTSDPRVQNLKEEISLTKKLYDEYQKLEKQIGATKAAEKIQQIYSNTIKTLQDRAKKYGFEFELPFADENLKANMQHFIDKMKELQGLKDKKGKPLFPNIGKEIDESVAQLEDVDLNSLQKALEKKLKDLADRISRTKTAKEFYEKILSTTGDYSLASKVAESIFGQNGLELRKALADQVRGMTGGIELPEGIISADNVIGYKALRQFTEANKNELGKMYDELIKISNDGQHDLTKTYEGYLEDLEKAKTYADKRVELARTTAEKIRTIDADIMAGNITEDVGKTIIRGLQKKESEEAAKLEYEAFKDTPLYVQMFEDLGQASSYALESMKEKLLGLQNVWGSALDPTQLKEIQSRINEIDAQLRVRNPFKTLRESYQQYHDALKNYTVSGAEGNVASAQASYDKAVKDTGSADSKEAKAAERTLDIEKQKLKIAKQLTDEKGKALKGQKALDEAARIANENEARARVELAQALADEEEAKANDDNVEAANEAVEAAKEKLNLARATSEIIQNEAKTSKTLKEAWLAAGQTIGNIGAGIKEVGQSISAMMEAFGSEAEDIQFVDDISNAVGDIFAGVGDIIQSALSGDVVGIVTGAITAPLKIITGFANLFSAGKVRRANKEIKKQQEILDQLEYSYGRLEKAMDKAFGGDYIDNYNQRMANLQAQAEAYRKQAEAEQSKGKDADGEKVQEYMNSYRDTMDQIADMQNEISEHMLGTDLASAARDFAKAWIDAYKEFGNTTDAISDKFHDMIENMVVEGAMAEVMKKALEPMYDMIDGMKKTDFQDPEFWSSVADIMAQGIEDADKGAQTLAHFLEQAGISLRDSGGELTGISRDIASASEESINGLAAGINTQNYYISYVPKIAEHVAAMRMILENGYNPVVNGPGMVDLITLQNESMNHLAAINQHTAETVVECRRIAERCTEMAADVHRVVVPKGSKGTHGIQVYM